VTLLIQFRIALQIRQIVGAQLKKLKICILNVYNNMIGHLRSSFDRVWANYHLIQFYLMIIRQINTFFITGILFIL